ncbi:MAG TPA: c-type cytochrome [Verrucomicrobiae bacterium]|nr:c-type cytochrome [Verrucomicrobiae bacterium]
MKWMVLCVAMVLWNSGWQNTQKADLKPAPASPSDTNAAKLVNPVKSSPVSLASGKKTYGTDCAMCHGKAGAGDGDLAADMKLTLKDFRDADFMKTMTDGDMYMIIDKGRGQMQGEEGRLKSNQIWDLVNYVRSFSKK